MKTLTDIAQKFNELKVMIIGDVMVDAYVWGSVERISPEAPVPVVHVDKREIRMGGAANVAKNVSALGAQPILCALVGNDSQGEQFVELLESKGVKTQGVIRSNDRVTTVKERVLAGSQQLMRVDSENDKPLTSFEYDRLLEKILHFLPETDVVIFEDYDKGVLSAKLIETVVKEAKARNIPTVVDPKKRNFLAYQGVSLFKPNLKEIKEGMKIEFDVDNPDELHDAVNRLLNKLDAEAAMITLSERGVFIKNRSEAHHIPAHIRQISDVSGAGDTVISIASLCMAMQLPMDFTAALANLGGGLVCEYLGVVPVDKKKLFEEAEKNNLLADVQ